MKYNRKVIYIWKVFRVSYQFGFRVSALKTDDFSNLFRYNPSESKYGVPRQWNILWLLVSQWNHQGRIPELTTVEEGGVTEVDNLQETV